MQAFHRSLTRVAVWFFVVAAVSGQDDEKTLRVFLFAGQSNMVGSDSRAADIERFPPFAGLDQAQPEVRFDYCIGRESKTQSKGWAELEPVDGIVGPELSFARLVTDHVEAPIAIIKVAAGGTNLGGDWNPDEPSGFEMYPLALERVRAALARLKRSRVPYRLEGVMWHQGENDMFEEEYQSNYGKNLANFIASWRRDLETPELRFYIGELCTKTVWGMDLRPRMDAIARGQRAVTDADPFAEYVPTSHIGVEIGNGAGLHYHYGTLGQLQHGESYAGAYLANVGKGLNRARQLKQWPYAKGDKISLFVLAGHRNMEGERAFLQELRGERGGKRLAQDDHEVAFRYDVGGGVRVSDGWEPLGPAGLNGTFGPEISFAARLSKKQPKSAIAIAKFTHSGSQIVDWTPAGSEAEARNLYGKFIAFVRDSIEDLEARGHAVELAGVFYHLGENDMSWMPARNSAASRLAALITKAREDLGRPNLPWFVSQQEPTDDESVNEDDVVGAVESVAAADRWLTHVMAFDLPGRDQALVLRTPGILELGTRLADAYLSRE